jgi:hypothetical protein
MAQRGRRVRGLAALTAAALVGLVAGGCGLLFGTGFGGFDPELMSSSPIATFTDGSATIAISGGETITLDEVGRGSRIDSMFGSEVQWSNADGWSLRLSGAGADFGPGTLESTAFVTIDRISGGEHWSTFDPGRCIVEVEVADETGLSGTATCRGLTWYDALIPLGPMAPSEVDEPEFDAEITFEATP